MICLTCLETKLDSVINIDVSKMKLSKGLKDGSATPATIFAVQ